MPTKGKRARITLDGRAIIIQRALQYPRIPRTKLAESLQKELADALHDVPQVEVLERLISHFRNHVKDDPQDKPWSTATLDAHPIPPEALAAVLRVWKAHVEKGEAFAIREAKWAARLSGVVAWSVAAYLAAHPTAHPTADMFAGVLSAQANRYAGTELMYELLGRSLDSTGVDRALMGLPADETWYTTSFLPLLGEPKDGVEQMLCDDCRHQKQMRCDDCGHQGPDVRLFIRYHHPRPDGENAISEQSPHLSPTAAAQLSDKEVGHERQHTPTG